jgi:uncharacterized small protein (TIGR04563 family)
MTEADKRKQSLYLDADVYEEIAPQATRLDRSLSWIVQKAWRVARKDIMSAPAVPTADDDERR